MPRPSIGGFGASSYEAVPEGLASATKFNLAGLREIAKQTIIFGRKIQTKLCALHYNSSMEHD